jgi:hypothetical protein
MNGNDFRVAVYAPSGRLVTVSDLIDYVDGAASMRALRSKGYSAQLLTNSRALTRLHAEFAATCQGTTLAIVLPANAKNDAKLVKIVETPTGEEPREVLPRDLAGPTADEVAEHTPSPREGKDGDLCGD